MISLIKTIAADNAYGFTYNIRTNSMVSTGISCAYAATQNSFGDNGLMVALVHALRHDAVIGGWLDTETNLFYWDSIKVFDKDEMEAAVEFGRDNKQIALFDIDNIREIRL